jgi:hypothetical protein
VVRQANESGSLSILLSGLTDIPNAVQSGRFDLQHRRFSGSLIAGVLVLAAFPVDGGDLGNAEVAERLGMSPSTSHRYISTLLALGLLERNPSSRRYRIAR